MLTISLLAWGSATERELRLWNVVVGQIIMTSDGKHDFEVEGTDDDKIDTLVTKMAELISKVATMIYIKMIVTQKWQ